MNLYVIERALRLFVLLKKWRQQKTQSNDDKHSPVSMHERRRLQRKLVKWSLRQVSKVYLGLGIVCVLGYSDGSTTGSKAHEFVEVTYVIACLAIALIPIWIIQKTDVVRAQVYTFINTLIWMVYLIPVIIKAGSVYPVAFFLMVSVVFAFVSFLASLVIPNYRGKP